MGLDSSDHRFGVVGVNCYATSVASLCNSVSTDGNIDFGVSIIFCFVN